MNQDVLRAASTAQNGPAIEMLATELRSRAVSVQAEEERLKSGGEGGADLVPQIRGSWRVCDELAGQIAALPIRKIADLEAKAIAFLWLDGGLTRDDPDPSARLVNDVMSALASGIYGLLQLPGSLDRADVLPRQEVE